MIELQYYHNPWLQNHYGYNGLEANTRWQKKKKRIDFLAESCVRTNHKVMVTPLLFYLSSRQLLQLVHHHRHQHQAFSLQLLGRTCSEIKRSYIIIRVQLCVCVSNTNTDYPIGKQ